MGYNGVDESLFAVNMLRQCYWKFRANLLNAVRKFLNSEVLVRVRGIDICLGVSSETERFRAHTYSSKEPETLDWLDEQFKNDDLLYEIGANIGVYSLYGALKNPGGRIYAFEPETKNFSRLCANLMRNRISNVVPCSFAVARKLGFDFFYVGNQEAGSALHSYGRPSDFLPINDSASFSQGMLGCSLDELISHFHLPDPTLLKIDVDGNEEEILLGAMSTLTSSKLRSILIEICVREGESVSSMQTMIEAKGFRLVRKSDWTFKQQGMLSQNYIFVRI